MGEYDVGMVVNILYARGVGSRKPTPGRGVITWKNDLLGMFEVALMDESDRVTHKVVSISEDKILSRCVLVEISRLDDDPIDDWKSAVLEKEKMIW